MGIFLCLGSVELAQTVIGDNSRKGHLYLVGTVGNIGIQSLLVSCHHHKRQVFQPWPSHKRAFSLERQFLHYKRLGELTSAVRAEIVMNQRITCLYYCNRMGILHDDRGNNKLVSDALVIGLLD